MKRSRWKGPYLDQSLLTLLTKNKNKAEIKTFNRNSIITPLLVGINLNVYNGKSFIKLKINEDMIGHKLGEFSPTRSFFSFKKKKNK